jgi:UrcA family protein
MRRVTTTILLAALATGAAQISQAATDDRPVLSQKVEYGDLDLSHMNGTKALYRRLLGAAESVCAPLDGRDLARFQRHSACLRNAMASSVAQVNNRLLTQYFESSKYGARGTGPVQVAMQR